MLKNLLKRRPTTKYTILTVLPLEGMDSASDTQIEDAMQRLYFRMQNSISQLGYRPRGLVAGMYPGGINTRTVVRFSSDAEAAQLLTALNLRLRGGSAAIDEAGPHGRLLTPRMALSAA